MHPPYPPAIRHPEVLPLVGIMTSDDTLAQEALKTLDPLLGPPEIETPRVPFTCTDYYEKEMGPGLVRWYAAFKRFVFAQELVDLKHRCAQVEAALAVDHCRRVNLDPGYVDLTKVVLASWKSGNYKIYLGRGVWADPVLMYEKGRFKTQEWTFPDLRAGEHSDFFIAARNLYKKMLREQRTPPTP